MVCGCTVFSSINDALSDYLDPGFNCEKLHTYSLQYDLRRISKALREWQDHTGQGDPAAEYRRPVVEKRLRTILAGLNDFFDHQRTDPTTFPVTGHSPASSPASERRRFVPGFIRNWIRSRRAG
jgi:hypothetical protein